MNGNKMKKKCETIVWNGVDGRASARKDERKLLNEQMKNYVNAHVVGVVSLKSDHRPNDHFAMVEHMVERSKWRSQSRKIAHVWQFHSMLNVCLYFLFIFFRSVTKFFFCQRCRFSFLHSTLLHTNIKCMCIVACCRYGTVATIDDDKTKRKKKDDFIYRKRHRTFATTNKEVRASGRQHGISTKFKWFECTHTVHSCALLDKKTVALPKVWWICKHRNMHLISHEGLTKSKINWVTLTMKRPQQSSKGTTTTRRRSNKVHRIKCTRSHAIRLNSKHCQRTKKIKRSQQPKHCTRKHTSE